MRVMMTFYETAEEFAKRHDPAAADAYWAAWSAYAKAVEATGMVVSGAGLQPPETATRLTLKNGVREVQDGPFADAKEHVGGFFVLEAPSLEVALEWAAKAPCASAGSVELRPTMAPPSDAA